MVEEDILEEITRRVFERVGDVNYVKLKALIRRFLEYNPDADVERIDWSAYYDDGLEFDELVEVFQNAYPMYRWDRPEEVSVEQYEDEKVSFILQNVEDLSEDSIRRIIEELEKRIRSEDEALEKGAEVETVQVAPPTPTPAPKTVTAPPKVVINLQLLAKYPWLDEARGFVKAYTIDEISTMEKIVQRAKGRIIEALERGELGVIPRLDEPFTELLSFPVAKAVVSTVDDVWLKRRWSLAEASRCERLLNTEPRHVFDFIVERLGMAQRNNDPLYHDKEYKVKVAHYLRFAGDLLNEPGWKLVNQQVAHGWVYITRARLTRIVRQHLYTRLYNSFKDMPRLTEVPESLATVMTEVVQKLQEVKARQKPTAAVSGRAPPCILAIKARLSDASHVESFILAAFLLNKGYAIDEVVKIFAVRADFDEKIARYQVEHIAGMRGSRVRYKPPSCQTMKTLGLCVEDGKYCPRNIRNPLEF